MNNTPQQKGIGFDHIGNYGIILENYRLLERLMENVKLERIHSYHLDYDWYRLEHNGIYFGIAVSQGAPMAVDLAERYLSSGVKGIIRIGTTGSLISSIKMGDLVVPLAAIKDEGTSNFYIDPKAPAVADLNLLMKVTKGLKNDGLQVHSGISWSTDGRWRETDEAVKKYIDSGAMSADMESSALFSFGLCRKVPVCSVSIVSDEISEGGNNEFKGLSDKDIWFNRVLPLFDKTFSSIIKTLSAKND